jgi:diadenylate cyclase
VEEIYKGEFRKYLKMLAPGSIFRIGVENILQANTGGLVVVGDSPALMNLVSGGFYIDCEYSPARLYELAKMDGAIISCRLTKLESGIEQRKELPCRPDNW